MGGRLVSKSSLKTHPGVTRVPSLLRLPVSLLVPIMRTLPKHVISGPLALHSTSHRTPTNI